MELNSDVAAKWLNASRSASMCVDVGIRISASVCDYRWEIARRGHLNPVPLTMGAPEKLSGLERHRHVPLFLPIQCSIQIARANAHPRPAFPPLPHIKHTYIRERRTMLLVRHVFLQRSSSSSISFHPTCMTHVPRTYNGRVEATTRTSGLRVARDENSIFPFWRRLTYPIIFIQCDFNDSLIMSDVISTDSISMLQNQFD